MDKYSPEQVKDIKEREQKALNYLKELQLTPAAAISKEQIGNDMFADKVVPFIRDTKYEGIISPIQDVDSSKTA